MSKGSQIRKRRIELGLSQTDLAEKVSVSKQTLYKYENDIVSNIPSDKIEAIAKVLHVTPAYIMGWSEFQYEEIPSVKKTSQHIPSLNDNNNGYYLRDDTAKKAQELFENRDLRMLFDAARDARPEDLQRAADFLKILKETNKDG